MGKQLVLAYFENEAAADQAADAVKQWDKASEEIKPGAIGIRAYHQGGATDVVDYLADHAERYGILKRRRNRDKPSVLLILMDLTSAASP